MVRTLNRLLSQVLRRRSGPAYLARSQRAPQDRPPVEARRRRWFTTGEIRRNRRESW